MFFEGMFYIHLSRAASKSYVNRATLLFSAVFVTVYI